MHFDHLIASNHAPALESLDEGMFFKSLSSKSFSQQLLEHIDSKRFGSDSKAGNRQKHLGKPLSEVIERCLSGDFFASQQVLDRISSRLLDFDSLNSEDRRKVY